MSAGISLHRKARAELDELLARGILTREQAEKLKDRYPVTPRGLGILVKLFTAIGAVSAIAGGGILIKDHIVTFWKLVWPWLKLLIEKINWYLAAEFSLLLAFVSTLLQGSKLKALRPRPLLGEIFELAGALALHGLVTTVAKHYSTGSSNWPATLGLAAALLLPMAYALANRLVLWYALALFFFFFGAETGYMSGWGAYYLGMTYPVRYLGIGLITLAAAWAHGMVVRGRLANFSRVYAHYGMLLINLALWFLSLFGYYTDGKARWDDTTAERLVFSALWAVVAVSSLLAGAKTGLKLLRGYGLTFFIINLYTFYFQFVAYNSGALWFLHFLVAGGSMLWLGVHMEKVKSLAMLTEEGETEND